MKKVLLALLMSILALSAFGFDKQEEVLDGLRSGDYEDVRVLLEEWEKESPSDLDMMTGWFNYYLRRKAESKNVVGYMKNGQYGIYSQTIYDDKDLKTGISYLDKALKKNPYRMDIHFGKISSLLHAEKYSEASKAITDFLKVYGKNKTEWYWTNNMKFSENDWNAEEIVLGSMQDYCSMFDYYADRSSAKKALDGILKLFPKNVIFLNYLSYYYSSGKEYDKAIEVLLKAYKIDPNDYIIVGNLALNYENTQNYKEAEKLYTIMSQMDSEDARIYAAEGLERIKDQSNH
ncbi:MAG: tetratricopeptide repeat protein [Treponema sp.]|nr:tetratricopeptide repeat protein [Treponema sp.]